MGIPKDSTAGRRQFERVMEERRAMDDPETFKGLRRGWFFGDKTFREELLEQMVLKMGVEHYGEERRETDEQSAERIVTEELRRHGWKERELGLRPKAHKVKIALAQRIAIGNDDVVEMDRSAVADGKLELCVQPAGSQSGPKTLKSANSENRPL